jgi:hypothetical protein
MGVTREYTVWCDVPECCEWEQFGMVRDQAHACKLARRNGWRKTKIGWACPKHPRSQRAKAGR